MELLEQAIVNKGKVFPGDILKVGAFLNSQIDIKLAKQMGEEIYKHFKNCGVTRILTIEASGIGMACITAQFFDCNVVFAKKSASLNMGENMYTSKAYSFTHKNENTVYVDKEYLDKDDTILIIDDFLAVGQAGNALIDIVNQAGAKLAGFAVAIEKGYQGGGDKLRAQGVDVFSLAIIDEMTDGKIVFRKQ